MLLSKTIKIKINGTMREYYNNKGYEGKQGDIIEVKVEDLTEGSGERVEVECDYCHNPYFTSYRDYNNGLKSIVHKNCCPNCTTEKMKEVMEIKYGEKNSQRIPEVKEKTKKTNLEKFGTEQPLASKEVREKIKKTNREKYGVDWVLANKDIYNKVKETNKEKYGVENPAQNKEVQEKIKTTNQKKYGRNFYVDTEENREKFGKYIPISKCQEYLSNLYEGKINVFVKGFFLDILLDNNIYCEYDGTGHDIAIRLRNMTEEEFNKKEWQRYHILKREKLKMFKIIQKEREELPSDDILLQMKGIAEDYLLNNEYNWIIFDLNNGIILLKDKTILFDYGDFRKI